MNNTPANYRLKLSPMETLVVVRLRRGWTQGDVAKRLKVPLRTVRSWEQGTRNPAPEAALAIAHLIGAELARAA